MEEKHHSSYMIPGAIVVAGVIVALAIVYSGGGRVTAPGTEDRPSGAGNQQAAVAASGEAEALLEAGPNTPLLGDPNAPVTIVEFGDFQCPFCGRFFSQTLPQIKEEYVKTGKVKFIWRDFAFLGQESFDAANAARCAGEQGKFWEYHDYLFEAQNGENRGTFSVVNLKNFGASLGLNIGQFNSCLDSNKYLPDIQEEAALARELGVSGTPASFVNGRLISGAVPFATFQAIIEDELSSR